MTLSVKVQWSKPAILRQIVPLIFPFYEGWCDSGGGGMYGEKSYEKMLNCALDSDKGVTKMEAWLDGNKIVDNQVVVDFNAPYNMKFAYDKLPQNKYFKVIKTPSFFEQYFCLSKGLESGSIRVVMDFIFCINGSTAKTFQPQVII